MSKYNQRYCADCKFHSMPGLLSRCYHPRAVRIIAENFINGQTQTSYTYCNEMRKDAGICGPSGLLWEPAWLYRLKTFVKGLFRRA